MMIFWMIYKILIVVISMTRTLYFGLIEESEAEEAPRVDDAHPSDDEDAVEGEDLLSRLQRILARKGVLCEPEFPTKVLLAYTNLLNNVFQIYNFRSLGTLIQNVTYNIS